MKKHSSDASLNGRASVSVRKIHGDSLLPTRGSEYAAGYDLHAYINDAYSVIDRRITIKPHQTCKIGTGIALTPPEGYFGAIFARSGLAAKEGLRPANCVGVADYDYTGEYIVALHNDSDVPRTVTHGDRIAQLVFLPYSDVEFNVVDKLEETNRGDGGFASTGR